ncbi:alpha/beta-hydrolase [Parathielavia hyrcaniae]|uniref:Alpha/beta-hydrolase n=1 Tax=Parathielavia hyrcaniae TaxID=113614 RepID=A0AAN6Q4N5_9PEZI|nr:alpha/beta-hydrolase [Parathielavia hyrcaniae]
MPVPFLGRLNITEYAALVGSFLLVGLEAFIRVFTLALPSSLLDICYGISRRLFNRLTSPAQKRAERRRKSISTSIRNASDFVDLCATFGYTAEEHVVQTKDGYLLGLHRLAWRKGEEDTRVNRGINSVKKRVVYLHHGLLMNSEVWVCLTDEQRALPFVLVDRGFDVWFGNNRGNKYSKKSIYSSPSSLKFWNFSIDEFAFHDIPDSIGYILETTGQPSLSYIGFSQGTAQAFASLAVHPKLNDQVNVFIALAPAMSPAGLSNGVVDALVKASPQVLFLLFGRRSILSSATMWESLLYPPLFTKVIDLGLSFLFNWRTQNISTSQKLAAYPHLYSFTSTKSVVHWFQIIRTKSFQMYDDDVHPPMLLSAMGRNASKYTKVARYPTRNIKTPIVLVYGGSDSLVDVAAMLRELPRQTVANEIPHYEHLDFLWARDVADQVFPHVFDALESFTGAEHTREQYVRYQMARSQSESLQAVLLGGGGGGGVKRAQHATAAAALKGSNDVVESDVSTAVGGGSNHEEEEESEAGVVAVGGGGGGGREERGDGQGEEEAAAAASTPATPTRTKGPRLSVDTARQSPRALRETHIPSPTFGPRGLAHARCSSGSGLEKAEESLAGQRPVTPVSPTRLRSPRVGHRLQDAAVQTGGDVGVEQSVATPGAAGAAGAAGAGAPAKMAAIPSHRTGTGGGGQSSQKPMKSGKGTSSGAST